MADGPYKACSTCLHRHSSDCEDCDNADLYELDEDALVEEPEDMALAA